MGFFLFSRFSPIDIFIVQDCGQHQKCCDGWDQFRCLVHNFCNFCSKIDPILLKYDKIVNDNPIGFKFKDRKELTNSLNQLLPQKKNQQLSFS